MRVHGVTTHLVCAWLGAAVACAVAGRPDRALGQTVPADDPAARLEFMRKSAEGYSVHPADDTGTTFRVLRDPVLRFTNPVGTLKDGALLVWTGEGGRPAAAVQAYWQPERGWTHELTSLSPIPLVAVAPEGPDWRPPAGVRFEPLPDAPRPAERAGQRLGQMRELVAGFTARHHYRAKVWNDLRCLAKPLVRYGDDRAEPLDGALFGFTQGTDPELLLMLEPRKSPDGNRWEYAAAPMTSFAVDLSWKGRAVWARPVSWGVMRRPDQPFHVRSVADASVENRSKREGAGR